MIFLGAGTSEVFGIKTMQDLTNDLVNTMRDLGHGETIDKIIQSLRKFNLTPDFESIYITLEALVAPEQAVRSGGPFTAYIANICKGFEEIKVHREFEEILFKFRQLIYDSCTIISGVIEKNRSVFDKLFQTCANIPEERRLSNITGYSGGPTSGTSVDVGRTIVTTNYDMSMELYHRLLRQPLIDGFKPTYDPFVKEFDPMHYSGYGNNYTHRWLIKLHGSIWQFKQENRIIKTIEDPRKSSLRIKIDEQMMIYPIGEKPILRDPYHVFYEIFRQQIWKKMIAIGYSFRDDPVNTALLEGLEKVEDATLIVVNPDAERVVKNLGSLAQAFNNHIIRIPKKFGDETMFEKLKLALKVDSWKRYQEREWEQFKEKAK
jgi:hypothetical protein